MTGAGLLLAKPIANQLVGGAKSFLLRLTDSKDVSIYTGTQVGFSVGPSSSGAYLGVSVPLYLTNLSDLGFALLRGLTLEMTGVSRQDGPGGYYSLVGSHLVTSLDALRRESMLSARRFKLRTEDSEAALIDHQFACREVLDGLSISPRQTVKALIEFRTRLGEHGPVRISGEYQLRVEAYVSYVEAMKDVRARIAEVRVPTGIDLHENQFEIRMLSDLSHLDWRGSPTATTTTSGNDSEETT